MTSFATFDSVDAALLKALRQGLDQNNREKGAPVYEPKPVSAEARDGEGELVGGLLGETLWGWLYIDLLWVKKENRQQGVGQELVKEAEAVAVKRGCYAAYLLTESFQAPGFYEKLGYQKFVVQEDFPLGHQRMGFMKRLAA